MVEKIKKKNMRGITNTANMKNMNNKISSMIRKNPKSEE